MVTAFFRNGIISAPTPRIAAHDSFNGQPAPNDKPSFLQCLNSILRTRRGISAGRGQQGRNGHLVKPYEYYKRKRYDTAGLHASL